MGRVSTGKYEGPTFKWAGERIVVVVWALSFPLESGPSDSDGIS